jgi:hypothetical protein
MTCCGMPSGGIRRRRMTRRSEIRYERRRISAVAAMLRGPRPRRQSESILANRVRRMATVPVRRSVLERVVSPPGRTARRSRGGRPRQIACEDGAMPWHPWASRASATLPSRSGYAASCCCGREPGVAAARGVWLRRTLTPLHFTVYLSSRIDRQLIHDPPVLSQLVVIPPASDSAQRCY